MYQRAIGTGTTTSLYRVTTGDACITNDNEGWIELHVYEPGPIALDIDVTPASLLAMPAEPFMPAG